MKNIIDRLEAKHWAGITETLHEKGFCVVDNVLSAEECKQLINNYASPDLYRKTISMERYRFGSGEYKYFKYPLSSLITALRQTVYSYIAPVANKWMEVLQINTTFPATHEELQLQCKAAGQDKPTVLILKYGAGGFNTLHQDLYGDIYFPMQIVLFLNEPGEDYTGGEFVLTEQIPRAQSKANVLHPRRGSMLIFTTNFRPVKGTKGYYRVNMKHGVSPVHNGNRHTLGIIFHDALS
nr:2OG-Fe(II) oxygenase [uncultured Chitinophaga sp.]